MTNSPLNQNRLEKLIPILTPDTLQKVYLGATDSRYAPSNLQYRVKEIYKGSLTNIYELTIFNGSNPDKEGVRVVLKRYLPPDEQLLTLSGSPVEERLDSKEYLHLLRFHEINSLQPRPLYYNQDHRTVIMERLDGSYHDRLEHQHQRFAKANFQQRGAIRDEVRADLESILITVYDTLHSVTREANREPSNYAVSTVSEGSLWDRYNRSIAALFGIGSHLDLATLFPPSSSPMQKGDLQRQHLQRLTPAARMQNFARWNSLYGFHSERKHIFSYLFRNEAVGHWDMLPGNILYRFVSGDKKRPQFALCDLGAICRAPFDNDLITLLMVDPRLKLMLTLNERKSIYDHHFKSLRRRYSSIGQIQDDLSSDQRFVIGSVSSIMRFMGAIYFYLNLVDPEQAIRAEGNLDLLACDPHLPLGSSTRYFGVQYASLLEILNHEVSQDLFPRLRKGVSSFFSAKEREGLESLLLRDPLSLSRKLIALFKRAFSSLGLLRKELSQEFIL